MYWLQLWQAVTTVSYEYLYARVEEEGPVEILQFLLGQQRSKHLKADYVYFPSIFSLTF